MAPQPDLKEMEHAWRALNQPATDNVAGWKTIRVAADGRHQIRAGRRLPGNEEALLVGFSMRLPKADYLPASKGFTVSEEDLGAEGGGRMWVALCREPAGSRELFSVVADDLARLLRSSAADTEQAILQLFIARIRAWQEFMQRGSDGVLAPESEIGLFGELHVLNMLVEAGVSRHLAVTSWKGPFKHIHDFSIGNGAIEVKTTIAGLSFPANVGSLEQLDDDLIKPIYVAAVRLNVASTGLTLAELVQSTRSLLNLEPVACREFDIRLLRADYFDSAATRYTRRFNHVVSKFYPLNAAFPRLVRGSVAPAVTRAHYEIDLDLNPLAEIDLAEALKTLGGTA